MCVLGCVYSIEIQTAGQIRMKFGTEVFLKSGKVLGWVLTWYLPPPSYRVRKGGQGASGVSTVHFGENFIEHKLQGTPKLVGDYLFGPQIRIRKDLGLKGSL